jgi:hypothetical protein
MNMSILERTTFLVFIHTTASQGVNPWIKKVLRFHPQ